MNETTKSSSSAAELSKNDLRWLSPVSLLVGIAALWAVWHFYNDALDDPDFRWYHWIQPILIVSGGLLCLVAAPVMASGRKSGWEWFKLAVAVIPVILAIRLVIFLSIVVIRLASSAIDALGNGADRMSGNSFVEWLSDLNPVKLSINIAILIAITTLAWLFKKSKSGSGENKDADGS